MAPTGYGLLQRIRGRGKRVLQGMAGLAIALLSWPVEAALEAIPAYEAVSIGSIIRDRYPSTGISYAPALNGLNDVAVYALIDNQYQAFIYRGASGTLIELPGLPGWNTHEAVDISNPIAALGGQIVVAGNARNSIYSESPGSCLAWLYDPATDSVQPLPIGPLSGFDTCVVSAVDDTGKIAGYSHSSTLTYGPDTPMIFDVVTQTLHDLGGQTAIIRPVDITLDENGRSLMIGHSYRAILDTDPEGNLMVTAEDNLGTFFARVTAVSPLGWITGTRYMGYHDGAGRMVVGAVLARDLESVPLDQVLWANSAYDSANGLNRAGDVVGTLGISAAIRGALYIAALDRVFLIEDLVVEPATGGGGWGQAINDNNWIAAGAGNATLLRWLGDMPVPAAPFNLAAAPHEPTWQQPWNAITLSWSNADPLSRSYRVERRTSSGGAWETIQEQWRNLSLWDTTVALGVTYDYRVFAEGIAGESAPSAIATATSPSDPVDRSPPQLEFAPLPACTATNLSITLNASDNRGLQYVEISESDQATLSNCRTYPAGATPVTLSCTWKVRRIADGSYTFTGYAYDAMGNWERIDSIAIALDRSGACNDSGGGDGGGGGKGKGGPKGPKPR